MLDYQTGLIIPPFWWQTARFDRRPIQRLLPSHFDWRDSGGCTPVRNQFNCGSCWAFATVAPLECNIKIRDGFDVDLSEQYLINCNSDGWGCNGGWFAHDYHAWKPDSCGGIGPVMEGDCPYFAIDMSCICPYPHNYLIDDWLFVGDGNPMPDIDSIKQAVMDYGPVACAVYADMDFKGYDGGIYDDYSTNTPNHAVAIVGWNDDPGYWIMRNSWGYQWGEQGYMRIAYGCHNIGYASNYVVYEEGIPNGGGGVSLLVIPILAVVGIAFVAGQTKTKSVKTRH